MDQQSGDMARFGGQPLGVSETGVLSSFLGRPRPLFPGGVGTSVSIADASVSDSFSAVGEGVASAEGVGELTCACNAWSSNGDPTATGDPTRVLSPASSAAVK